MSTFRAKFEQAIDIFDGNNPAPLRPLAEHIDAAAIDELLEIELASNMHQIAATWLIKAWVDDGNSLNANQIHSLINNLEQTTEWGALLHVFQMLESHTISNSDAATLLREASKHTAHQKTLVRAWALFALALAGHRLPNEKAKVQKQLEEALATEKGSVAVRVRRGLELLNL